MSRRRQEEVASPGGTESWDVKPRRVDIRTFDPDEEEWEYYLPYFELELKIARVREANDRRDLLLTKVGAKTFKMLIDHYRPGQVGDQPYETLVAVTSRFYTRASSVTTERVAFARRQRGEEEPIGKFVNALRALAGRCAFGIGLEERVRDQLIIGINNNSWQYELLKTFPTNTQSLAEVEALANKLEQGMVEQKRIQHLTGDIHRGLFNKVNVPGRSQPPTSTAQNMKARPCILVRGQQCLRCSRGKHRQGERCKVQGQSCVHCASGEDEANYLGIRKLSTKSHPGLKQVGQTGHSAAEVTKAKLRVGALAKKGTQVMLNVLLEEKPVKMLYDPGAHHSVISKTLWKQIGKPKLTPYPNLVAYTNVEVKTLGKTEVTVEAFGKVLLLPVIVVSQDDIPLFGLEWVLQFGLPLPPGAEVRTMREAVETQDAREGKKQDVKPTQSSKVPEEIRPLLLRYPKLFDNSTGTIMGHKIDVLLKPEAAVPKVFKPRPVPFALQAAVEQELVRLLLEGIIEPVDPAMTPIEWASPLVIAPKPQGKIRLCADFKVTINKYIVMDKHPLPTFEEVCAEVSGGEQFSVIDLKDAYLQMEVEEKAKPYLIIATHKGFFRYKRMPFGISSAPAKFQKTMERILAGIPGVICYLDDIIITARNRAEHLNRIAGVLQRLNQAGMRVRLEKCKWLQDSVVYLGHKFDRQGIHPTDERIKAMRNLQEPRNVKKLRAFLGCINYYQRFIPNVQGKCAPLHLLLQKGTRWNWTAQHHQIVEELKGVLTSGDTLVHYNPALPLVLYCDASEMGVGAVLCHRFQDGTERPIAYTSKTLSVAERRYSVIDREALGIVNAVRKFERYFIRKEIHSPN